MNVTVVGAGSLGSLLGGLLASEHAVTLVGREPHVSAVRDDGLRVTGEYDLEVAPDARTEPPASADLALVTVKAYDTDGAARALRDVDLGTCLSLQNGLGNEERLADVLDCPVLAGTCTYGARLREPGVVECTGLGAVTLGPRNGGESVTADDVGESFRVAGVETTVVTDMPRRLWLKLAVNAGINAPTALADVENGAIVEGTAREVAVDAARETAQVARAHGVELDDETAVERTLEVARETAANRSSMLQDVDRERRTEIDAINGAVVERAEAAVPVNATLTRLVRAWERERGLR